MSTIRESFGEKVFKYFNISFLIFLGFITLYPFWNVLALSFNDPIDAIAGGIYFWPRSFSLINFTTVFEDNDIGSAAIISVARTLSGTFLTVIFTAAFAYAISKSYLLARKFVIIFMIITLYFSGGLIPTYFVIRNLGLLNNFLVLIIPMLLNVYYAIIMMTFFKGLPTSLMESAKIDGANDLHIFYKIVLPISMPVIAAIALFAGIDHWNAWFDAMIYADGRLDTLQLVMVRIIRKQSALTNTNILPYEVQRALKTTPQSILLATMVVTTLPIIFSYPFLQKYFVKGIMIGSLKG